MCPLDPAPDRVARRSVAAVAYNLGAVIYGLLLKALQQSLSEGGPHRRNPALVHIPAVKGRPEMADIWLNDATGGMLGSSAPAGRRQHICVHKEVRYGDNGYPSRS